MRPLGTPIYVGVGKEDSRSRLKITRELRFASVAEGPRTRGQFQLRGLKLHGLGQKGQSQTPAELGMLNS